MVQVWQQEVEGAIAEAINDCGVMYDGRNVCVSAGNMPTLANALMHKLADRGFLASGFDPDVRTEQLVLGLTAAVRGRHRGVSAEWSLVSPIHDVKDAIFHELSVQGVLCHPSQPRS